jgi:uncharacterized protein (DUF4415 family)
MKKLSDEAIARLKEVASRPDSEIDLTDMPELQSIPAGSFRIGDADSFYRPVKRPITIRLDADVIAWLKASGDGYQTRINSYLRQMMKQARQNI